MNTTARGNEAEHCVAQWLERKGYKIIDRNWRNRWCEIDIVASHKKCIYFVEVRYRKNPNWGDGLESITAKKLTQMTFAAELWQSANKWHGECQLAAASVAGDPPIVEDFILV